MILYELQNAWSWQGAAGFFCFFILLMPFLAVNLVLAILWTQIQLAEGNAQAKEESELDEMVEKKKASGPTF